MRASARIERVVKSVLENFNNAFASKSVDAVLKLFTTDSDVTFIGSEAGEYAIGRSALESRLKGLFSREEFYTWKWNEVSTFSVGLVAWAVVKADIQVNKNTGIEEYTYRITAILEKRNDQSFFVHFHGSEPVEENS